MPVWCERALPLSTEVSGMAISKVYFHLESVNEAFFGEGLCRWNEVKDLKMRSSWMAQVALNTMTRVLMRKGKVTEKAT